jgi:hypothetical protein
MKCMNFNDASPTLRIISILILGVAVGGCCTYESADHDDQVAYLISHRCVVARPAMFPRGGTHWLPSFEPPTPYPLIRLEQGTILRITHIEHWSGPIDPSGSNIFAEVENGPKKGTSIAIGIPRVRYAPEIHYKDHLVVWCNNPYLGLGSESGRTLEPFQPEDEGLFYAGDDGPSEILLRSKSG